MDKQDIRTLRLLEEIENNQNPSQRELANKLDISLGLVNSFLKRLSHKGYFKITNIPKKRISYILTTKGFAEKSRLTYEYIRLSYNFYREARSRLKKVFSDIEKKHISKVVFYGAGDLGEIAYLSLKESSLELVGVVDPSKKGENFFKWRVGDLNMLSDIKFDMILITSDTPCDKEIKTIVKEGVLPEKIITIQ